MGVGETVNLWKIGRVGWLKLQGGRRVSTNRKKPGGKMAAEDLVGAAKREFEARQVVKEQQLSLLGTPDPEDMEAARERLGPDAGNLVVLNEARRGRGRPKGSRNKRTEDFRRYALQFGQHPAITMMQIQNTAPEVLVERSRALDGPKRRLSYGDAQQLRLRAAEGLMPYMESKMPVAVELGVDGDFNLIIPGVNMSQEDAAAAAAGEFVLEADFNEVDEEGEAE